jgi:transcription factor SPN1
MVASSPHLPLQAQTAQRCFVVRLCASLADFGFLLFHSVFDQIMSQRSLHDTLLDMNALEIVRNWLAPFPAEDLSTGRELPLGKRTLPNLTLRGKLYAVLKAMPIMPEHLKNSERGGDDTRPGLGKVALMLLKHPGETAENKRILQSLLEDWSRRIFKRTHNYKQLSHHIRESDRSGSSSSSSSAMAAHRRAAPVGMSEPDDDFLGDGHADAAAAEVDTGRVRLPIRVGFDFKVCDYL